MNPVFSEAKADLESIASDSLATSYGEENLGADDIGDEDDTGEGNASEDRKATDKGKSLFVKQQREKRERSRYHSHALCQIATEFRSIGESQEKRHKLQMESEKERDRQFLEFKKDEAERNANDEDDDGDTGRYALETLHHNRLSSPRSRPTCIRTSRSLIYRRGRLSIQENMIKQTSTTPPAKSNYNVQHEQGDWQ